MMNISTTSIHFPQYYHQFRIIQGVLLKISFPYIFIIGFIGLITNTTTVVLLSKNFITKNLKNKWTLIALALSDLVFNIALLIRGIHDILKGGSDRLCIIISFLSHLAELLSACYTVSFTIQRYTAVRYPLKVAVDRRSSPMISLSIIFLFSFLFCFFLSHKNVYIDCHEELELHWFIADALSSFVIPFFLILIFNILIVNFIRKHSRSPISVQSTLLRKKKSFKNNSKTSHHDETCVTDNNTITNVFNSFIHSDEYENIELKNKKEDKILNNEMDQRILRSSISLSLDQMNFDTSSNQPPFPLSVLSKPSSQNPRRLSHDSLIYRLSGKSSSLSNDTEVVTSISTRTSQSIRLTRMLILVSTCFLILNAPAHLCVIALKIYTSINTPTSIEHVNQTNIVITNSNRTNNETLTSSLHSELILEDQITIHLFYMAVLLTQLIAYASYSINFFLYSFSGIAFRTSLRQLLQKFRRH